MIKSVEMNQEQYEDAVNRILGDRPRQLLPDESVRWRYHIPFRIRGIPDVSPEAAAEQYLAELRTLIRDRQELGVPVSDPNYVLGDEDDGAWGIVGAWDSDI